jgi:hypothetical protein
MTSSCEPSLKSESSTTHIRIQTSAMTIPVDLRDLPLIWSLLTPEQHKQLLSVYPEVAGILDSLCWAQRWTKTKDEQDLEHPYKPLPDREYFGIMHDLWKREPVLYIEKSRSMITSWFATAETLHYIMTHQPAVGVLWAQDERRAVKLRDYAWVLWEQQDARLKELYPAVRPKEKQSYDKLELADGGILLALPGKDPDVIRSHHPTVLLMDEACFIENGGEAFDVALASRVPWVRLISTAAPSWIRRITKVALAERMNGNA